MLCEVKFYVQDQSEVNKNLLNFNYILVEIDFQVFCYVSVMFPAIENAEEICIWVCFVVFVFRAKSAPTGLSDISY